VLEIRDIEYAVDDAVMTGRLFVLPAEQRLAFEEEMRAAGVDWQLNVYGGTKHSFTNRRADQRGVPEVGYHEAADTRSWRAMTDLFDEVFAS
jgi:dienelactone hydrolase